MQISTTYTTCLPAINKIYTFEGKDGKGTVFLEFDQTQRERMERFCYDISKSGELLRDYRIPKGASRGFCFGYTIRDRVESLEALIKKVESWVTWGLPTGLTFEVPLIPVDDSALEEDKAYMPQKDYSDLFYEMEALGLKPAIPYHNDWNKQT